VGREKDVGTDRKRLGRQGEDLARRFLEKRRYAVLAHNFSCPFGEIDLVCRKDGMLVFVEVKTRRGWPEILPEESVGPAKRRRLIRCALFYLKKFGLLEEPCRFDIISVHMRRGRSARIRWLRDCIWELAP